MKAGRNSVISDGIVTNFHKRYEEIMVSDHIETYIQSTVLKKALESTSFDQRNGMHNDEAMEISTSLSLSAYK
ncbi:unnamed protein product [Thelazia callipaeda]|uniref:Transposase n=1 Tax=Thelazia callipaeda TaxID=103827 RepID=A0A0N5CJ52_THECL|nr:unnamed protein product [Thelazia callipaeda]